MHSVTLALNADVNHARWTPHPLVCNRLPDVTYMGTEGLFEYKNVALPLEAAVPAQADAVSLRPTGPVEPLSTTISRWHKPRLYCTKYLLPPP